MIGGIVTRWTHLAFGSNRMLQRCAATSAGDHLMAVRYLLATDICIYIAKHNPPAVRPYGQERPREQPPGSGRHAEPPCTSLPASGL